MEDILCTGEQISTGIREATLTGNPYPIKGWLSMQQPIAGITK